MATAFKEPMPGQLAGLSRLNETERRVLCLLAEGHTAKSIATELDMSIAAVNERLREARRKTGLGSSREVARLLKAQESRYEQLRVVMSPPSPAASPPMDAEPRRPHLGVIAMIAALLTVAAGASTLLLQDPPAGNQIDPMIGAPIPDGPNLSALHAKVRTEPRDNDWASTIEGKVRARVSKIPLIGTNGNELRVLCASTLCEISGSLITPPKAVAEDQHSRFSRTITELQVPPLPDDLAKMGLKMETGLFTGRRGKPDRSIFILYYTRLK